VRLFDRLIVGGARRNQAHAAHQAIYRSCSTDGIA